MPPSSAMRRWVTLLLRYATPAAVHLASEMYVSCRFHCMKVSAKKNHKKIHFCQSNAVFVVVVFCDRVVDSHTGWSLKAQGHFT